MHHQTLSFIGAGNMAAAMIAGLLQHSFPAEKIQASHPRRQQGETLQSRFHIQVTNDNKQACKEADVIIFAVKPQVLPSVLEECRGTLQERESAPLFISVAAGVDLANIENNLFPGARIVRLMPNTPATIGLAATGLVGNDHMTAEDKSTATMLADAIGISVWLETEAQIDIVTAVSGSGPAYVFYFMQALIEAAVKQGLPENLAKRLVQQTLLGSVQLTIASSESLAELRKRVTSPGGTTAAGLSALLEANFDALMNDVISRATIRAKELGQTS